MTTLLVSMEYMCNKEAMKGLYQEYEKYEQHNPTVICFTQSFDQLCETVDGWKALTPEEYWRRCTKALCTGTSVGYRIQAEACSVDHLRIVRDEMYQPEYALFVEYFLRAWFLSKDNPLKVKMWRRDYCDSGAVAMSDDKPLIMS